MELISGLHLSEMMEMMEYREIELLPHNSHGKVGNEEENLKVKL